jgi:hypothetical protein
MTPLSSFSSVTFIYEATGEPELIAIKGNNRDSADLLLGQL